jgi:predicted GH43/DUF377 family glycosyl hydrolase
MRCRCSLCRMARLVCTLAAASLLCSSKAQYTVSVGDIAPDPVFSWLRNNSAFFQAFNPAWVSPSSLTAQGGLFVRVQSCRSPVPGSTSNCTVCDYAQNPSHVVGAPLQGEQFPPLTFEGLVFGPQPGIPQEACGTEDPRVVFVPAGAAPDAPFYLMMYTAVGVNSVFLSSARARRDPWSPASWERLGSVIPPTSPLQPGSKSGAVLVQHGPPHYLFWGDTSIRVGVSQDLTQWNISSSAVLLAPRPGMFDSRLVESGPPPVQLSTGDWLFVHNSADDALAYHASFAILNGSQPTQVLQRAEQPLLSPSLPWMRGWAPELCNVPNVVFVEAMAPLAADGRATVQGHRAPDGPDSLAQGGKDQFRIWFGGSDAVVGTAVVSVTSG